MSFNSHTAPGQRTRLAAQMLLVRLRLPLLVALALAIVACWPYLRAWVDRIAPASRADDHVADDIEYWCPMCPGVLSDWPGKCPVCNMALVRRHKGEAGGSAGNPIRMQLSPYRVQLAGAQTSVVDYVPARRDVLLSGTVATPDGPGALSQSGRPWVKAEAFEEDLTFLAEGQLARISGDTVAGRALGARLRHIGPTLSSRTRTAAVWLEVEEANASLRQGSLVTVRVDSPATEQHWCRQALEEEWAAGAGADLMVRSLLSPVALPAAGGAEALLRAAAAFAQCRRGLVLAVPESAVVDHGAQRLVYVESMPGMFEATPVVLGPRCGDSFPLLAGLSPGQRVATAGAFLLDAEARLSPALSAAYFGASRSSNSGGAAPPPSPGDSLSPADRELAHKQKICPVTGEDLDSMGGPVKVEIAGHTVFLCCNGCEKALRRSPEKYLQRIGISADTKRP